MVRHREVLAVSSLGLLELIGFNGAHFAVLTGCALMLNLLGHRRVHFVLSCGAQLRFEHPQRSRGRPRKLLDPVLGWGGVWARVTRLRAHLASLRRWTPGLPLVYIQFFFVVKRITGLLVSVSRWSSTTFGAIKPRRAHLLARFWVNTEFMIITCPIPMLVVAETVTIVSFTARSASRLWLEFYKSLALSTAASLCCAWWLRLIQVSVTSATLS